MALRTAHGSAAAQGQSVVVEVVPPNELPFGVRAPLEPEEATDRDSHGRLRRGNRVASKGGRARLGTVRKLSKLRIDGLASDPAFAQYLADAKAWARAERKHVAASVGGGVCSAGPSSMIDSAALALAASRFLYAKATDTGDATLFVTAAKLSDSSRQNVLAARETAAREARSRVADSPMPAWPTTAAPMVEPLQVIDVPDTTSTDHGEKGEQEP